MTRMHDHRLGALGTAAHGRFPAAATVDEPWGARDHVDLCRRRPPARHTGSARGQRDPRGRGHARRRPLAAVGGGACDYNKRRWRGTGGLLRREGHETPQGGVASYGATRLDLFVRSTVISTSITSFEYCQRTHGPCHLAPSVVERGLQSRRYAGRRRARALLDRFDRHRKPMLEDVEASDGSLSVQCRANRTENFEASARLQHDQERRGITY